MLGGIGGAGWKVVGNWGWRGQGKVALDGCGGQGRERREACEAIGVDMWLEERR